MLMAEGKEVGGKRFLGGQEEGVLLSFINLSAWNQ